MNITKADDNMMQLEGHQNFIKSLNAQQIYVGFSGGIDSTALLLILHKISIIHNLRLIAVHFQHNLRGSDSIDDASWCKDFCKSKKINFIEINLDVIKDMKQGEGIEAAARRLRNNYYQSISRKSQITVALGHHAEDKAENLILRICRGSNSTGLTSMRKIQKIGYVNYIRPIIRNTKDELIHFLEETSVDNCCVDKSNNDEHYKRNFIRHNILPDLYCNIDYSKAGIQHSIDALSIDADFIESESNDKYKKIIGLEKVPLEFFSKLHPALLIRVLRYWLHEQLGYDFLPNHRLIKRMQSELNKVRPSGKAITIPVNKEISLKLYRGKIEVKHISDGERPMFLEKNWNWKKNKTIRWNNILFTAEQSELPPTSTTNSAYFDSRHLPDELVLRNWLPGDTMIPFGRMSVVKLKKLFTDMKYSMDEKARTPILCDKESIIWVPGLRRSSSYTTEGCNIRITMSIL